MNNLPRVVQVEGPRVELRLLDRKSNAITVTSPHHTVTRLATHGLQMLTISLWFCICKKKKKKYVVVPVASHPLGQVGLSPTFNPPGLQSKTTFKRRITRKT